MERQKFLLKLLGIIGGLLVVISCGSSLTTDASSIATSTRLPSEITATPIRPTSTQSVPAPSIAPASSATLNTNVLTQTLTVGDYQYQMECNGEGGPVVLLLGGRAAGWKPVQAEMMHFTRTCVFDHMGRNSDPLTSEQLANNTHTLLIDAQVTGPYVLVGFSVGGYITRLFTNSYPDEVAGMVLLDSSHEDQNARFLAALPSQAAGDCQALKDFRAELSGPHLIPLTPQINLDFDTSATQVRAVERNLGQLPLLVLTAGRSEWPECFPLELQQRLDRAWLDMQNDLASLSANSTHLLAKESGHSFADQPEVVIDAIQRVVQAVRTGGSTP